MKNVIVGSILYFNSMFPHQRFDHEQMNMRLAKNYKLFKDETQKFKKSSFNKTHKKNL